MSLSNTVIGTKLDDLTTQIKTFILIVTIMLLFLGLNGLDVCNSILIIRSSYFFL